MKDHDNIFFPFIQKKDAFDADRMIRNRVYYTSTNLMLSDDREYSMLLSF